MTQTTLKDLRVEPHFFDLIRSGANDVTVPGRALPTRNVAVEL